MICFFITTASAFKASTLDAASIYGWLKKTFCETHLVIAIDFTDDENLIQHMVAKEVLLPTKDPLMRGTCTCT